MSKFRSITAQTVGLVIILLSVLAPASSQTLHGSIHLSLIHRDSSLSPLHNPALTPYDRIRYSFVRSKSRLSYLINRADGGDFQGTIEPDDGEYFVNFTVGTPPVQMLASIDTASELVLISFPPCTSCNDDRQTMSLTYNNITCNTSQCTLLPNNACDSSNTCSFSYGYPGFALPNSLLLGSDTFSLETSNGEGFPLDDVIFGSKYGDQNQESISSHTNGIVGLGFHNLSLIMQMGLYVEPQFTYCLGNISDPEAERRLILGNAVFLEGQTTPLNVIEGRYNIVLEGLSIGKRRLPISPQLFQQNSFGGGGVIIDAGTTLTFLAPDAYYVLVEELEQELGLIMELWPNPPYERCYIGQASGIKNFQGVIFHFERDVHVRSDVENLFLQVEDGKFCLGVLPSPVGGASVLGSLFQQSYSVGYHLGEMLLSFQRIDCEVIDGRLP